MRVFPTYLPYKEINVTVRTLQNHQSKYEVTSCLDSRSTSGQYKYVSDYLTQTTDGKLVEAFHSNAILEMR